METTSLKYSLYQRNIDGRISLWQQSLLVQKSLESPYLGLPALPKAQIETLIRRQQFKIRTRLKPSIRTRSVPSEQWINLNVRLCKASSWIDQISRRPSSDVRLALYASTMGPSRDDLWWTEPVQSLANISIRSQTGVLCWLNWETSDCVHSSVDWFGDFCCWLIANQVCNLANHKWATDFGFAMPPQNPYFGLKSQIITSIRWWILLCLLWKR